VTRSEAVRLTAAAALLAVGVVVLAGGGLLSGLSCIAAATAFAWHVYRNW
jgi:hypothetical protein